jgi:hypothetical protein
MNTNTPSHCLASCSIVLAPKWAILVWAVLVRCTAPLFLRFIRLYRTDPDPPGAGCYCLWKIQIQTWWCGVCLVTQGPDPGTARDGTGYGKSRSIAGFLQDFRNGGLHLYLVTEGSGSVPGFFPDFRKYGGSCLAPERWAFFSLA